MPRSGRTCLLAGALTAVAALTSAAEAQKTLLEEVVLFGFIENSFVGNLGGAGHSNRNELRYYDLKAGYTFNMAELSVKKDASDRYPFGFGLVITGGEDAQKNHALGIFRDEDDAFPFATPKSSTCRRRMPSTRSRWGAV